MRHSIKQFTTWLALLLATLAVQGLGQSTPQQVKGTGWQAATTKTPAVASDGTNLYIAWTGLSNHEIYFAMFNGKEWTDHQVVAGTGWTAETSASPALVFLGKGNGVLLFWRGLSPNEEVWFSQSSASQNGPGSWTQQRTVSGEGWQALTKTAPTATFLDGRVYVGWLGAGSPDIWFTSVGLTGTFAEQTTLSGPDSSWTAQSDAAPALASYSDPASDTIAFGFFWRGSAKGHIWEWEDPDGLSPTEIACMEETSAQPAATFLGSNRINDVLVFWKDESDEGISYQLGNICGQVTGKGWTAQTKIAPAVATVNFAPGSGASILAWLDAGTNTILYIDPTTLY